MFGYPVDGYVDFAGGKYIIHMQPGMAWPQWCETLLHEWPHAMTFHGNDQDLHGSEWGLAYAKVYDAYDSWSHCLYPQDKDDNEIQS